MNGNPAGPGAISPLEENRCTATTSEHERLREFFRLAPSFMFVVSGPDHVFERANPAFLRLIGGRDLVGRPLREALSEVVAQGFVDVLDRVYRTGDAHVGAEVPVRLARGKGGKLERRYVTFAYQALRDGGDAITGIAAHGTDVTDAVRAREALAEREAHFRSLIENSQDRITVLAADGTIRYESPAAERLLGWKADEVIGRNAMEFIHPEDHAVAQEHMVSALREPNRPWTLEHRLIHRDGSWRTFETVGQARPSPDGLELVTNSRDVTERRKAEGELRASEERFRVIQDASPDGFMLFRSVREPDGAITDFEWIYTNPAGGALLRRTHELLVGRRLLEELPGHLPEGLFDMYVEVVEKGAPRSTELLYTHEGLNSVFRMQAVKVGDGFGVTFSDITEAHTAAMAIREREERFRALVELIPQLVWSATPDGRGDYFNQRWYDYTGANWGGQDGGGWDLFVHPEDRSAAKDAWARSLETGEPFEAEFRFQRAEDGAYRWFISRALPLRDGHGDIIRWFGTATDVHDERVALETARATEERFATAARATNDVIWDWDLTTDRFWCNDNAERVLGLGPGESVTTFEDWERWIHPEDWPRVEASLRAAVREARETWVDEYRLVRGDGTVGHVLDRGILIRNADGKPARMIGSMLDLTERMELEQSLRQAQKLEAVGQLAGGVAHDFNNLLTIIINYADIMLVELPEGQPVRGDAQEIWKAANRAATLTRQLLAFSRRQVLQPRDIDLNEIVTDMDRMLRRVIGEHLVFVSRRDPRLHVVRADPGQIEQVIVNLVVNARDAMPDGGTVTLSTQNVRVTNGNARRIGVEAGDYVALSVEDTGIGMDHDTMSHVFEPFFTTKPAGRGTGLGLATVHGIVRQSGGHISIDSAPGQGTHVRILLPAVARPATSVIAAVQAQTPSNGAGTILLVEDEEAVRGIAHRCLVRSGYTVLEARNGTEALDILQDHLEAVDLIISDLVMPELGGRELAASVREMAPDLPVLFMSGYAEEDMLPDDAPGEGAGLLEKPFTVHQLTAAVARILGDESST